MAAAAKRLQLSQMKYDMAARNIDFIETLARFSELSAEQKNDFLVRFQDLEKSFQSLTEMYYEIQLASADQEGFDLEDHQQLYESYNKKYYFVKRRHLEINNAKSDSGSGISTNNGDRAMSRAALPRLQIPTFSGKIEEFAPFMELFQTLVGSRDSSLSDTEKMYYLAGSLLGEPKTLIQHLSVTGDNFSVAIDLLNSRYNNKRLLADRLLHNLMGAPHVNSKGLSGLKMLLNTLLESTKALQKMDFPVDSWSYLLFYINFQKFDNSLRKHFEDKYADKELPTFADLLKFLETEIRILESSADTQAATTSTRRSAPSHAVKAYAVFQSAGSVCKLCKQSGHFIAKCERFLSMKPTARKRQVMLLKLCFRCLNGHNIDQCNYNYNCYKCNSPKHHHLLHFDLPASGSECQRRSTASDSLSASAPMAAESSAGALPVSAAPGITGLTASIACEPNMYQRAVLLATAVVRVLDSSGNYQEARALLDGGSQSTFISESCVQRLGLKRFKSNMVTVTGLSGAAVSGCRGAVNLTMLPKYAEQPSLVTTAAVLHKITNNLPGFTLPSQLAYNYRGLYLADEQFYLSREIDILIGADLICDIMLSGGCLKINDHLPRAMNTVFGHVLTGPITYAVFNPYPKATYLSQTFFVNTTTDQILERFWEVEDIPVKVEDPKDMECESLFKSTHQRDEHGRYIVRLPLLADRPKLGNSVPLAAKRFMATEKRLQANNAFRMKYVEFMREYLETGHMSRCDGKPEDYASDAGYIIPHHGIFKADSDKIRVVFDASCATNNGVSLNDCLHAGPKLQRDIAEIICKFRLHNYVFTSDIRMMFRQILIAEADRQYQLIFWRDSPDLPLRLYRLNTVTYGMKSSPYLAIRVLRQLADDEESRYPAAARLLRSSVYMDDILGGADTLGDAIRLKQELTDLLRSGGFELSKWTSNSNDIIQDIPEEHLEKPRKIFDDADETNFYKVLGIQWDAGSDSFSYRTQLDNTSGCTKRSILSTLARTFDSLGWICPVIFQGKILMQQLWLKNLPWDAEPPADVIAEWRGIVDDLPLISQLRIERFVLINVKSCSVHGFSDASELGYGAAVYLRTVGPEGQVKVSLLMAKSRVAPIKSKLTIPKLELSGAALLVRLLKYVVAALSGDVAIDAIVGWCDSTIVLSWLRVSPHLLQTFEGNRVSQMVNCGLDISWRHLPSEMNPADVASRGCRASELIQHPLWWGPSWLTGIADTWPKNIMDNPEGNLPGLRKTVKDFTGIIEDDTIFTRFSSLNMLLAVVAYCFRFVNNAKGASERLEGALTVSERRFALERLVKLVQRAEFAVDIQCLKRNKQCSTRMRRLAPFISNDGLLRVGGRLVHSGLPFGNKHPMILPKAHALSVLIVDHYHILYCHAGATVLLSVLQRHFWILSAGQIVRTRIFKCIKCFRTKARPTAPMMAALPSDRVNATGVFHTVQTDFAGPFTIKHSRLRNAKTLKAYLCVFICSSSKGVHLECVTDLSTDGFLAALTRFTSRRGFPSVIRSDCGTNYVGANRYLDEVRKYLASREVQQGLSDGAAKHLITWRFNSPAAPHFGGLFEATVKSAKTLLRRVIGEQVLTFDELVTVFTRVEAVLNCRPLCPLSRDPHELEVLTPAHLLIGRPLLTVPEYNFEDVPNSRLNRFNLIQAMSQRLWRKWSEQYLHTLQMRRKWTSPTDPPKLGDLVLIKEENLPPLKWRLGRIEELLPGKDGFVRVVKLKTSTGTMMRPVVKICRLPLDD